MATERKTSVFVDASDPLWIELSAIAEDEGLSIYDIERLGSGLRIFVDRPQPVRGESSEEGDVHERVTVGDCSKLCERLRIFFVAEGMRFGLSHEPFLEVSSPGINRVLRRVEHFESALGERVRVIRGERGSAGGFLRGVLTSVKPTSLTVLDEATKTEITVGTQEITRAHVDFDFK